MKPLSAGPYAFAIFLLIAPQLPVRAQTSAGTARPVRPFEYNINKEVTLFGPVTKVLTQAAPGMIAGAHLLIATSSGPVDASLGKFGLRGRGAVSVAPGQQIEATGVMRTIQENPVLLVRCVKVGGEFYTIRNQHGVLLSPQARERASQKNR